MYIHNSFDFDLMLIIMNHHYSALRPEWLNETEPGIADKEGGSLGLGKRCWAGVTWLNLWLGSSFFEHHGVFFFWGGEYFFNIFFYIG